MSYKQLFQALLLGAFFTFFSAPQASAAIINCNSYSASSFSCYASGFDSFNSTPVNPTDSTPITPIKIKPAAYLGYKKLCADYLSTKADLYNKVKSFDFSIQGSAYINPLAQRAAKNADFRNLQSSLTAVSNIVHKYGCDDPSIVTTLTPAEAIGNVKKVFPEVFGVAPNQSEINYWVARSIVEGFGPVTMKTKMQYYKGLGKTIGEVKAIATTKPAKQSNNVSSIGANVPAIVERLFSQVYGRKLTASESNYWKMRARTDKVTEPLLKGAMQFSKDKGAKH